MEKLTMPKGKDHLVFGTTEWKNKTYIVIRTHYTDENGELQPTKKGFNLSKDQFLPFLAMMEKLKTELVKAGVFDAEDLTDEMIKEHM